MKNPSQEQVILQNTLDWYLEKLSPELANKISGLNDLLTNIQTSIKNKDIPTSIKLLMDLYNLAQNEGLIAGKTSFPGPGKDFKNLAEQVGGQINGILKEELLVGPNNYKVLGLVLADPNDHSLFLYDPINGTITSRLSKVGSPRPFYPRNKVLGSPSSSPSSSPRSEYESAADLIRHTKRQSIYKTSLYPSTEDIYESTSTPLSL